MRCKLTITFIFTLLVGEYLFAQDRVVFSPQWVPQAQFAGYYAAEELGFYDEEGLDVDIKHPTTSLNVIDMLKNGDTDIITSMTSVAMLSNTPNLKLCNVMQLMPNSQLVIISNQMLNGSLLNLEGASIATWKSDHSAVAIALLKRQNVNVEWVYQLAGTNIFLADCVDAMLAMEYNELQTIRECGKTIENSQIINLSNIENLPEDGLYTLAEYAKSHPERIAKFRRASIKGWQWVAQHREEAVDLVLKVAEENQVRTNRYHQRAMLNIILDNGVAESNNDFTLSESGFNNLKSLLLDSKMIDGKIEYNDFVVK